MALIFDLGDGWRATEVRRGPGVFARVQISHGESSKWVRLDVPKRAFLDPPGEQDPRALQPVDADLWKKMAENLVEKFPQEWR